MQLNHGPFIFGASEYLKACWSMLPYFSLSLKRKKGIIWAATDV